MPETEYMAKQKPADSPAPRDFWRRLGLGAALVGALVSIVLGWTGIGDWRPLCGLTNNCPEPSTGVARNLSPDSPVAVIWTGEGDTVEATWDAVSDPELDHYAVDIVGLYPETFRIDAGYRLGEELETSRTLNPASDTVRRFEISGDALTLTPQQTWQICVTASRAVPDDAYVEEEYEIQGSERCSDPFALPTN